VALHSCLASAEERLESEGRGATTMPVMSRNNAGELERGRAFRLRQGPEST